MAEEVNPVLLDALTGAMAETPAFYELEVPGSDEYPLWLKRLLRHGVTALSDQVPEHVWGNATANGDSGAAGFVAVTETRVVSGMAHGLMGGPGEVDVQVLRLDDLTGLDISQAETPSPGMTLRFGSFEVLVPGAWVAGARRRAHPEFVAAMLARLP